MSNQNDVVLYQLCVSTQSVNPDTGECEKNTTNSVHTALAAALQQAENEIHGMTASFYTVQCTVPVKQVCSQIMASRNRTLFLALMLPGAESTENCELRAPQICKLLDTLAPAEGKCTLTYTPQALFVDYAA